MVSSRNSASRGDSSIEACRDSRSISFRSKSSPSREGKPSSPRCRPGRSPARCSRSPDRERPPRRRRLRPPRPSPSRRGRSSGPRSRAAGCAGTASRVSSRSLTSSVFVRSGCGRASCRAGRNSSRAWPDCSRSNGPGDGVRSRRLRPPANWGDSMLSRCVAPASARCTTLLVSGAGSSPGDGGSPSSLATSSQLAFRAGFGCAGVRCCWGGLAAAGGRGAGNASLSGRTSAPNSAARLSQPLPFFSSFILPASAWWMPSCVASLCREVRNVAGVPPERIKAPRRSRSTTTCRLDFRAARQNPVPRQYTRLGKSWEVTMRAWFTAAILQAAGKPANPAGKPGVELARVVWGRARHGL